MEDDKIVYKRNPIKKFKKSLRNWDESGPPATLALNFGGEEAYRNEWPAICFIFGQGLVLFRLAYMLMLMFTFHEPLITEARLGINLEELGEYKIGEELDFDFAVKIVGSKG